MNKLIILIISFLSINIYSQSKYSIPILNNPNIRFGYDPVNIEPLNSKFDDYNSYSGIYLARQELLIFSTNRISKGHDFDYVSCIIYIDPNFDLSKKPSFSLRLSQDTTFSALYLDKVNSTNNEYGPYMVNFKSDYYVQDKIDTIDFFITREINKQTDIYHTKVVTSLNLINLNYYKFDSDIKPVSFINSKYNESYISYSRKTNSLLYCSDKDSKYDIYQIKLDSFYYDNFTCFSNRDDFSSIKINQISSDNNDKCPFVHNNIMVLTSDREGGYGGYDLYYSLLTDNGSWSKPINLGENINSEYDEFRPIIINFKGANDNIMIFSSNRPDGKGGYDLYVVRLPLQTSDN